MRKIAIANDLFLPEVANLLNAGNPVTLRVKGNSMRPFIAGGRDCVLLKKPLLFRVGDIALAEVAPQVFVLHRILHITQEKVTLMGDGNLAGKEYCTPAQLLGRAEFILKGEKKIDCNATHERFKALLWRKLQPIRPYLLAIYVRLYP